ncbi:MAG: hypothetical protein ACJAWX_000393 [Algoriphagus sp.]|jgi:hypothetical protein
MIRRSKIFFTLILIGSLFLYTSQIKAQEVGWICFSSYWIGL